MLIRGLLRESRHWGNFTEILREQLRNSAEILTPDIPGNGRFHSITSPKTVADMVDVLRQQIPLSNQRTLIALSMGGMIAIDWMIRYPDEIKAAVLINTSTRPFSPFYHRLRWRIYPILWKFIFRSPYRKEADILALTSNRHNNNSELLNCWRQWQQQYPVSSASSRNQFFAAAKFYVKAKPHQPILIVTSKADRLVDFRCSFTLHQIWDTDYISHDTAGHDLPLDEPEWLANTIRQWTDNLFHSSKSA